MRGAHRNGMQTAQVFLPTVEIVLSRHLPVPPARLWQALTTASEMTAWMGYPVTLNPGPGGAIRVQFSTADALEGVVCSFEPGRRFAYTWGDSIVRFEIAPDASSGETLVTVAQTGVSGELAAGLAAGWHGFLDGLQAFVAGTPRGARDPNLLAHYKQVYTAFSSSR